VKLSRLIEFCKAKEIFVPPKATREYLEAAIVRAYYNDREVDGKKGCFGFWEQDDSNCTICDFRDECFSASIGMDREAYFAAFEKQINPRIRFKNSTSRFSRRPRKR